MNWKEIKKKYPKALEKFGKSEFPNAKDIKTDYENSTGDIYIETDKGSSIYYLRDLYDFFDEQGIFIRITFRKSDRINWGYYITQDFKEQKKYFSYYTRGKAEEAAFLKAFEILEEQLK